MIKQRKTKKENKQGIKRVIDNNLFILKYAYEYTPGYLILACIFAIYAEIQLFFEFSYSSKFLLDTIENNGRFSDVAWFLAIITASIIVKILFGTFMENYITRKAREKLHKNMQMKLFEKAIEIDLACYDNPDYYNEFVWSISEANNRVDQTIDYLCGLLGNITVIITTGTFIILLDKIGLIFILVTFILTFVTNLALGKLRFNMDVKLNPLKRKRNYINRVFYLNNYAKEIRLNDIKHKFEMDFNDTNKDILDTINKHSMKQVFLGFLGDYVFNSFILDGLYIIYLLFIALVKKAISLGSVIALFNSSWRLKSNLQSISSIIPKLQQNSLYVEKMRTFLDYKQVISDAPKAKFMPKENCVLELKNVTFAYSEKNGAILKNISLKIKPYEKIAFVGYNGAGKTTLTKLLMRLYDVSEGEILYNNVNIKDYKIQEYRNSFGAVFQDYQIFASSIAENVLMNEVKETDTEHILEAIQSSGFTDKLNLLNKGIHTQLTREFDETGVNLSGGEAQKLAIARVFAKTCPIIILDEPSSALDPISEYNLNETMLEASKNKTVIFISHRLSSTLMADRVYMLENGEIIEEGSHAKLMSLDGKYAEMFNLQAEKYRDV
jgi:ATP-binding cassette subfamily B protein